MYYLIPPNRYEPLVHPPSPDVTQRQKRKDVTRDQSCPQPSPLRHGNSRAGSVSHSHVSRSRNSRHSRRGSHCWLARQERAERAGQATRLATRAKGFPVRESRPKAKRLFVFSVDICCIVIFEVGEPAVLCIIRIILYYVLIHIMYCGTLRPPSSLTTLQPAIPTHSGARTHL